MVDINDASTKFLSNNIEDYPEGIVLPIDKPYRWTSADVIRKLKYAAIRHFGKKNLKVGHAGTLDPLATGILLVCIGAATKRAEELQASRKQYIAGVSFGATTASYDLEKEVDAFFALDAVNEDALRAVLPSFVGEQQQVAPLFSAKSVDGVRAYETARRLYKEGRMDEAGDLLRASTIHIYGLELMEYSSGGLGEAVTGGAGEEALAGGYSEASSTGGAGLAGCETSKANSRIKVADISALNLPSAKILVDCSKGTYIRALARDLGEALGSGAFLNSLRRTRNGGYDISQSISIEDALKMLGQK